MAWETALDDLLNHTVTISPHTGRDVEKKPTYGTAVSYPAKVVMKSRYFRNAKGIETVGRGTVYVKTTTVPGANDELTMPSGFEPLTPPIVDVLPHYDDEGLHHVELIIG